MDEASSRHQPGCQEGVICDDRLDDAAGAGCAPSCAPDQCTLATASANAIFAHDFNRRSCEMQRCTSKLLQTSSCCYFKRVRWTQNQAKKYNLQIRWQPSCDQSTDQAGILSLYQSKSRPQASPEDSMPANGRSVLNGFQRRQPAHQR